jgi:hypothetical protein
MGKPSAYVQALLVVLLTAASGCAVSDSQPTVWLGTSPFCKATQQDCTLLGLTYIRSDTSGDGFSCLSGAKVLCAAPIIPLKPAAPEQLTHFTTVQYNIMDRPYWVGQEGQRERVCRIPQALVRRIASQEHVDALVFNESFSGTCAGQLKLADLLSLYGWHYHLPPVSTWWKPGNGGIVIASRWPIIAARHKVFTACRFPDCLAAKGVQYARIEKSVDADTKRYHLFGTHLQAWGGAEAAAVRSDQAREMVRFIQQQNIPVAEPVILAGDLNTRGPENPQFQALLEILGVSMPPIVGPRRATMDVDNTLFGRGPWLVDYVLPALTHQRPLKAEIEIVRLRAEHEFAICIGAQLRMPTEH